MLTRFFQSCLTTAYLIAIVLSPCALAEQALSKDEAEADTNEHPTHTHSVSVLPLEELRIFTKAFDHIRNAYIEEIDDKTLLEYAIRGMLSELDPHSSYLDAESFKDLKVHTTGEFGGLGIEVGIEEGYIKVISPIDNTPASRAGIEAGDLIIELDGASVKGLTLNDAVEKMRGPKGTKITLTIMRKSQTTPIKIVLERDVIKVRSVRARLVEEDFAYLRIAQFQVTTASDVEREFKSLKEENPNIKGVILDLRNNPGGVLHASVEVSDLFLEEGLIVYTDGRLVESDTEYRASPGDMTGGLPLVVLINDGSASASEIVAGAIQDQRRGLVIGTRSFGKGSVQTVIGITNEQAIKLTTSLYYTPAGRSIQAQGIEPDLVVERVRVTSVQQANGMTEADLSGHLKNTTGGKEVSSKDRTEKDTDLHDSDSQLYEAVNLLKGLRLFNQDKTPILSKPQQHQAQ